MACVDISCVLHEFKQKANLASISNLFHVPIEMRRTYTAMSDNARERES